MTSTSVCAAGGGLYGYNPDPWHTHAVRHRRKDINGVLEPRPDSDDHFGRVQAINLQTGQVKRRRAPQTSSVLAKAGGLIFEGDRARRFRAPDSQSGNVLWETRLNTISSATRITYQPQGEQFVTIVAGGGGGHAEACGMLAPEIKMPDAGITLWLFKVPTIT